MRAVMEIVASERPYLKSHNSGTSEGRLQFEA